MFLRYCTNELVAQRHLACLTVASNTLTTRLLRRKLICVYADGCSMLPRLNRPTHSHDTSACWLKDMPTKHQMETSKRNACSRGFNDCFNFGSFACYLDSYMGMVLLEPNRHQGKCWVTITGEGVLTSSLSMSRYTHRWRGWKGVIGVHVSVPVCTRGNYVPLWATSV